MRDQTTFEAKAPGMMRVVAFGFLATFMSSLGQTFFVGLFSPQISGATDIGRTTISLLYGIATLASGSLLFWLGGAMDRLSLRTAVTATLGVLASGCLMIGSVHVGAVLLIAFFLLRLGGQGLLTQLAVVAAARNGGERRATTIAWSAMGVIAGEALLPSVVIVTLGVFDWRGIWLMAAVGLVLTVWPGLLLLSARIRWREPANTQTASRDAPATFKRATLLTDRRFWAGTAILLIPPFMATGFLFEQTTITQAMNWNANLIGAAFSVFALFRAFGTWFFGRTADRFGATIIARVHLLPMALAFGSLALPLGPASIWCAFAGIGFTNGANSVLSGALWADIFGTAAVGVVRGVFGAAMVLASALAPVTVAFALSTGLGVGDLGIAFAVYAVVVPLIAGPFIQTRAFDP